MPCGSLTRSESKRLNAVSPSSSIEWFTGWVSCVGLDKASIVLLGRAFSSTHFEGQIVQQVAKVRTDNPELPVLKGTLQTVSNGAISYHTGVLDISADTSEAAYVRWGVWQLDTATTAAQYIPIAAWLPALLVDKAKLAAIVTNLTGNLQWRLVYRTATTSTSAPGAWNNVTDADAPYAGGEVNTGDLAVSLGSFMWVQFGIAYFLSSGGAGQATITAALGTRRS